jgi:hypothetical protein
MDELWQVGVRLLWNLRNSRFVARSRLSKSVLLVFHIISRITMTKFVSCRLSMLSLKDLLRGFNVLPFSAFNSREELRLVGLSHGAIDISKVNVSLVLVIDDSNLRRWILFKYFFLVGLSFLLPKVPIQILIKLTCFKFHLVLFNFIDISIKRSPVELSKVRSNLILNIHFTGITIWNNSILRNGCLILLWKSRWINLIHLIEM